MKFKELKTKSDKDLQKILEESRSNLREMRFKAANDQLKSIRDLRKVKKTIVKVLFILSNKKTVPSSVADKEIK